MVRIWLLLAIIVATSPLLLNAQTPANCPTITVTGPAGIVAPGDMATFVVSVDVPEAEKAKLVYLWSSDTGEIASGQWTASIAVRRQKGQSLVATVEVAGLPAGCPNTASELMTQCDGLPIPEKIGEFDGASFKGDPSDLNSIVREMNDNPTNQLFIFFGYQKEPQTEPESLREQRVLSYLSGAIGGRERITTVKYFDGVQLVQFWRVPPGASNPVCDDCGSLACPKISVIGPAGITMPGDTMVFSANVDGPSRTGLTYRWTIGDDGKIVAGQGSPNISVETPKKTAFNITATVEIRGLDPGCPNTVSETAPVACRCDAVLIDEYPAKLVRREEMSRLVNAAAELEKRDDGILYFIVYFKPRTSDRQIDARFTWLKNFLVSRGVRSDRLQVVSGGTTDEALTKVYYLPPGAEPPAP